MIREKTGKKQLTQWLLLKTNKVGHWKREEKGWEIKNGRKVSAKKKLNLLNIKEHYTIIQV